MKVNRETHVTVSLDVEGWYFDVRNDDLAHLKEGGEYVMSLDRESIEDLKLAVEAVLEEMGKLS